MTVKKWHHSGRTVASFTLPFVQKGWSLTRISDLIDSGKTSELRQYYNHRYLSGCIVERLSGIDQSLVIVTTCNDGQVSHHLLQLKVAFSWKACLR